LLGMQPTFKHVPPSVRLFSTQATFIPSWAARIAATYPPGPAPMTTRSNFVATIYSFSSRAETAARFLGMIDERFEPCKPLDLE
jgi:hypothetical protein